MNFEIGISYNIAQRQTNGQRSDKNGPKRENMTTVCGQRSGLIRKQATMFSLLRLKAALSAIVAPLFRN
jgi:ribosomal protein S14